MYLYSSMIYKNREICYNIIRQTLSQTLIMLFTSILILEPAASAEPQDPPPAEGASTVTAMDESSAPKGEIGSGFYG